MLTKSFKKYSKGAKQMNKKTLFIIILAGLALFGAGSFVGASSASWLDQLSVDSAAQIDGAAKAKANDLTQNLQANIEASVKAKIAPTVDEKKQDISAQLQAYFDQKTSNITNSQQYQDAVSDLDRIETNLLAKYKQQIDTAFAGQ